MKFEIKNRWTGKVIFEADAESIKLAVELAVKQEVVLDNADLADANLYEASLDGASLDGARLDGASLVRASLVRASLDGARLDGASLDGARLDGASLDGASLDGASLDGASLDGASLVRASLVRASLVRASLEPIRDDFWAVLAAAPNEVAGLRQALVEGRVDGSTYEGKCACLVGTIANIRQCGFDAMPDLRPNSYRPAERFFLAIRRNDTPENNQFAAMAVKWIDEWTAKKPAETAAK